MPIDNELFWPSLYSRLVPHAYGQGEDEAADETSLEPEHFLTDFRALRHHIETDLVALLNATNLEALLLAGEEPPVIDQGDYDILARDRLPLDGFPEMRRSIVNYGLPTMIGRAVYRLRISDLEDELRQAILAYEPRLNPDKLRVRVTLDEGAVSLNPYEPVGFDIEGEVRGTSASVGIHINTIWDLEKVRSQAMVER